MNDMHGRPTAEELVEAVREFLEKDVMAATEGRVQFHTRVAINALNTVHRELQFGAAQQAAHDARLRALGFADDAELARAIRAGETDDRYEEIKAAVFATVVDKLEVANPKYLQT
jgi:Domain of unknown function (DUF6285)